MTDQPCSCEPEDEPSGPYTCIRCLAPTDYDDDICWGCREEARERESTTTDPESNSHG